MGHDAKPGRDGRRKWSEIHPPEALFKFYQKQRRLTPGQSISLRDTPHRRVYIHLLFSVGALLPWVQEYTDPNGVSWLIFRQPCQPKPIPGRTISVRVPLPKGCLQTLMRRGAHETRGLSAVDLLALGLQTRCVRYDQPPDQWDRGRIMGPPPSQHTLMVPIPIPKGAKFPRWDGQNSRRVEQWARFLTMAPLWSRWAIWGVGGKPMRKQVRLGMDSEAMTPEGLGSPRRVIDNFRYLGARYERLRKSALTGKPRYLPIPAALRYEKPSSGGELSTHGVDGD